MPGCPKCSSNPQTGAGCRCTECRCTGQRTCCRLAGTPRAGQATILTPHPLEAARLLQQSTADIQAHRLQAAQTLAERLQCTVVLKGSGSIIASPAQTPHINPTGNARLAIGGTGDVLAGMVAARWQQQPSTHLAACEAVWEHGALAENWPSTQPLTASALACTPWQGI